MNNDKPPRLKKIHYVSKGDLIVVRGAVQHFVATVEVISIEESLKILTSGVERYKWDEEVDE